jgi:membrane dipeptidase
LSFKAPFISRSDYLKLPLSERFKRTIELTGPEEERAAQLHKKLLSIDLHTHITTHHEESGWEKDRERLWNSGVSCLFEAQDHLLNPAEDFQVTLEQIGSTQAMLKQDLGFILALSAEDIRRAKREQKEAVMLQLEPQTIGPVADRVDIAHNLGVRCMLLTFNSRNFLGDGCGEKSNAGLSNLGFDVVERMNKVGMLIDLSHCGERTTLDAIEASKGPVLINHAGARALNPEMSRLKNDEQIHALAEKHGVFGVSGIPNQLSKAKRQGIHDVLNHVDYVVKLIGVNHVAIGLDICFDDHVAFHRSLLKKLMRGTGQQLNAEYMEGIESPEEWPNITRGLVSRGYSDQEIEKIIGGNALRIIEQVVG